jgi:ABC-type glycerol-3-phosphate transport system substrate-binding protein
MISKTALLISAFSIVAVSAAIVSERVTTRAVAKDNKVTVIYWEKWTGQEGEEMRKIVNAFNASQDRIFVKYLSISGIAQKTMLATAGGTPPDVAGIWQEQVFQFSDLGALTDLTDLANAASLNRDYYIPAYYEALSNKGRLWALPCTPASIALHVRADLVPADVASPDTFPTTLEGLDALSERISKKKPNGAIELAGFLPSSPGWWPWAWGPFFGGSIFTNNKPTIDTPEMRRAFKWIESYSKKFGAQNVQNFQSGFGNFASPQDPFMEGKTATELNGSWKGNYIRVYRPNTEWFAVPFPYPEDKPEEKGHTALSQDVLVIPKGAKHVKEAFEFIRFVQRQDMMEQLCIGHGKNSPLNKVSDAFYEKHPNKSIRLFDTLARSSKAYFPPRTGIFPQISNEIGNAFQQVNTGTKSPEEALKEAQTRIDGLWSTYERQVLN